MVQVMTLTRLFGPPVSNLAQRHVREVCSYPTDLVGWDIRGNRSENLHSLCCVIVGCLMLEAKRVSSIHEAISTFYH